MKRSVVYDTSYVNTRKIAKAIADTLRESGIEVATCIGTTGESLVH